MRKKEWLAMRQKTWDEVEATRQKTFAQFLELPVEVAEKLDRLAVAWSEELAGAVQILRKKSVASPVPPI